MIGNAGVGKSRLAAELVASVEATVVRGRCLPYGDGITYWPVVEVLKQLDELPADENAAAAIRSLLGASEAATSAEEIAWAFRKTLEQAAVTRPLVVVFDDVQWGEETLRDLIEHVALLSSGAAILLLCIARPELVERHPAWPVTLRLEPLGVHDVEQLIPRHLTDELRERIARAAGGNPLFIEEMLAMAGEADGDVAVPPTLQALLGARLDQLEPTERLVLERGAIEGEIFHRGAVQALAPEETARDPAPGSARPQGADQAGPTAARGEDGFRFRHILIRDAAYDALPKATRAEFHARFATWLEQHGTELVELDELRRVPPRTSTDVPRGARVARRRGADCCGTDTLDVGRLARARAPGLQRGSAAPRPRCRTRAADGNRALARAPARSRSHRRGPGRGGASPSGGARRARGGLG